MSTRIAVVGAGIAGATLAQRLHAAGHDVVVLEKSRGAGGRMSTRRSDGWRFDHGAQYFTARSTAFMQAVEGWIGAGAVVVWPTRLVDLADGTATPRVSRHDRYVATPGMNALAKHLLSGIPLRTAARVAALERVGDAWQLLDEHGAGLGCYDAVVSTAPPAQTAALLREPAPALAAQATAAAAAPCWAVMLGFETGSALPFDGARIHAGPLDWIAREASKPGRPQGREAWVVHASPAWTEEHLELDPAAVGEALVAAFRTATGWDAPDPAIAMAHRWLYARTGAPLGVPYLWDESLRVGVCGDWLLGARVEAAWLSASALARRMGGETAAQVS